MRRTEHERRHKRLLVARPEPDRFRLPCLDTCRTLEWGAAHRWSRRMKTAKLVKRFRVDNPENFKLAKWDPSDTCDLNMEKDDAKVFLAQGTERLSELQERLYAQDRWAVLVIF